MTTTKPVSKKLLEKLQLVNSQMNSLKSQLGEFTLAMSMAEEERNNIVKQIKAKSLEERDAFKALADDAGADVSDGSNWSVDYDKLTMTKQ